MKTYHVVTKEGTHEFDIKVTETEVGHEFALHYSKSDAWTRPGDHIMTLKENDHDGIVTLPKGFKKLEADQVSELGFMLKFVSLYGQEKYTDALTFNVFEAEAGIKL